ncbi:MAG: di-trans,poly-cis-decaprenylcistransferase, partial [Tissierellia bacterium]|nr:di-trans,poly-cis-decaprenylcistransferase [Tissierellia bacterium]
KLLDEGVVLKISGDIDPFPELLKDKINSLISKSANNYGITLNICLNYGGRAEITEAFKKIYKNLQNSDRDINNLTYEDIEKNLYTAGLPDVDLLIRPSGEQRLSNFLLLQSAYAELWFSDILWPDFSEEDLLKAIYEYQNRDRRFGGL